MRQKRDLFQTLIVIGALPMRLPAGEPAKHIGSSMRAAVSALSPKEFTQAGRIYSGVDRKAAHLPRKAARPKGCWTAKALHQRNTCAHPGVTAC